MFLRLALARRGDFGARFDFGIHLGCRSFDGQAYIGTLAGVISCRTVRHVSAQEKWDTEFVLSIKGTPWSPDGERAGDVNIRVDLLEAGGDRGARIRHILTRSSSAGECASIVGCSGDSVSPPGVWGMGHPANHTERCRERIEQELEKESEGASQRHENRGP